METLNFLQVSPGGEELRIAGEDDGFGIGPQGKQRVRYFEDTRARQPVRPVFGDQSQFIVIAAFVDLEMPGQGLCQTAFSVKLVRVEPVTM